MGGLTMPDPVIPVLLSLVVPSAAQAVESLVAAPSSQLRNQQHSIQELLRKTQEDASSSTVPTSSSGPKIPKGTPIDSSQNKVEDAQQEVAAPEVSGSGSDGADSVEPPVSQPAASSQADTEKEVDSKDQLSPGQEDSLPWQPQQPEAVSSAGPEQSVAPLPGKDLEFKPEGSEVTKGNLNGAGVSASGAEGLTPVTGDTEDTEAVRECELLGKFGSFGWWLQLLLCGASFASLVYKRFTDTVIRPWKIWYMDITKQGVAAVSIHTVNIGLSALFGIVLEAQIDPCDWYWVIFVVDCTLGVVVIGIVLKILVYVYRKWLNRPELADTGNYGDPPSMKIWRRQLIDFQCVALISKIFMLWFVVTFTSQISDVASVALGPLKKYPKAKLVFVMVVTPLLFNVMALWIVDSMLQGNKSNDDASTELLDPHTGAVIQTSARKRRTRGVGYTTVVGRKLFGKDSKDGIELRDSQGRDLSAGPEVDTEIGIVSFDSWRRRQHDSAASLTMPKSFVSYG